MNSVLFVEKKLKTDELGMSYLSWIIKGMGHTVDMVQGDVDNADLYLQHSHVDFVMYSVTTGLAHASGLLSSGIKIRHCCGGSLQWS